MRCSFLLLLVGVVLAGCNSTPKNENAVMKPPPKRIEVAGTADPLNETGYTADTSGLNVRGNSPPEIVQASASDADEDDQLFGAKVVATVNGTPIFAADIIAKYADYLRQVRPKVRPEQYRELREQVIRNNLSFWIDSVLLAGAMRNLLKPEQIKGINEQLDKAFEPEIKRMMHELKVQTTPELERELAKRGTRLEEIKQAFINREMAGQYIRMKLERPPEPSRQELVSYYQAHLDDYLIPEQVRWQQLQVSFRDRASKQAALDKLEQAIHELQAGTDFGAVAKKYSDGPTASDGGAWDWIERGSLKDTDLEQMLFELPVGQISEIYEGESSFQLVKPNEHRKAGYRPFEDVQDEIRKKLEKEFDGGPRKLIDDLRAKAVIETEYDLTKPRLQ